MNKNHNNTEPSPHVDNINKSKKSFDFNYIITKYFLQNVRLTILTLIFFILVGAFATLSLKTTGFPSPEIGVSLVQTTYPGASSNVINEKVTIPLEGVIKNVEGVKRFNSTTVNSFSNISVQFNEGINLDSARNRLDSAIKSVSLPTEANSPKLIIPQIGAADVILAISNKDIKNVYDTKAEIVKKLSTLTEISNIAEAVPLDKQIDIQLNSIALSQSGITIDQIKAKVASFNETIPVASNVEIDSKNASIVTSLKNNSIEDLENLTFTNNAGATVKLSSFAKVETVYNFERPTGSVYGVRKNDGEKVLNSSSVLNIQSVKNTDQNSLVSKINSIVNELGKVNEIDVKLSDAEHVDKDLNTNKINVVKAFTAATDNNEQVQEVIGGLIGGNIKELGSFGFLGWLFGGIWLVMLTMIFIVSWRAALISALSIPLSFIFSTIFLYITGESLNTLTLFSLVLVTGLVVDPTLVVLEAIQRKLDAGVIGVKAVLDAISDVGMGVFLAMVTNIIVFAPFGVLSGVFGQIFRYIPYTIVPAIIGSYLVPIVALSWFGSMFLKKNSHAQDDEEKNLWPVAKWLIATNTKILSLHKFFRFLIILLCLVVPILATGMLFSNGSVKFVQFASSDDAASLQLSGSFLNVISNTEKEVIEAKVLDQVASKPEVKSVYPFGQGFGYLINLKEKDQRNRTSEELVKELDKELQFEFGETAGSEKRKFFDIKVGSLQTGGSSTGFQTAIAIKSENADTLKKSSIEVGKLILAQSCVEDNKVSLKTDCKDENKLVSKVDDGYSFKENILYDVALDREALLNNKLASLGRGPVSIAINQGLANQISINQGKAIGNLKINDVETDVVLTVDETSKIKSTEQLKNALNIIPNAKLGEVTETLPAQSIQRQSGKTTALVNVRFKDQFATNQGYVGELNNIVTKYYTDSNSQKAVELGLEKNSIGTFADGQAADAAKAFSQLGIALLIAIILSYIVLAIFFNSFLQPLTILYTIPITFIGVFPALAYFVNGQFGFLEIIGLIILIGIVENVAIFLIDGANQMIKDKGASKKDAISYMSGVRLKPVIMTKFTTLASLLPLAILSEFYRSISTVIIGGLLVSGFVSLITTPILYVFFDWLSATYRNTNTINKILFFPLFPIYIIYWAIKDPIKNKIEIE